MNISVKTLQTENVPIKYNETLILDFSLSLSFPKGGIFRILLKNRSSEENKILNFFPW